MAWLDEEAADGAARRGSDALHDAEPAAEKAQSTKTGDLRRDSDIQGSLGQ